MKVAILTSPNQWFISYANDLKNKIPKSEIFFDHEDIKKDFDVLFILSYHKIIKKEYLKSKHNIVIHASDLPSGKGWAPMFWQISDGVDDGDIYMKKTLKLTGLELNEELRYKQASFIITMCEDFLSDYIRYSTPTKQIGEETFYKKRASKDSELDLTKTINEQFNLLRIVDNEDYPAFFYKNGKKYILKIEEANDENR